MSLKDTLFARCCDCRSAAQVAALTACIDGAREVTVATFVRHVGTRAMRALETMLSYTGAGLRLGNDPYVSFHTSRFAGVSCAYVRWSAIEHIFVPASAVDQLRDNLSI